MRVAHTRAATWPSMRPGRFAASVRSDSPEGCRLALLGLPDDTGVRLNFGRTGAAAGPAAFRAALSSFGTSFDGLRQQALDIPVFDAGDVLPSEGDDEDALHETHRRAEAAARELHQLGLLVIGIGGGHDLSLPTITALSKASGRALGGVNLDAHLDVRERIGSGMPFRRLIEGSFLDPLRFVEFGLGRFANEQHDFEWLSSRGAELILAETVLAGRVTIEQVLNRALGAGPGFVSIDLDGLDASAAPGVSAPNPLGLGLHHAAELAEAAGAHPQVLHFDVMELCPSHDQAERTARSAAYLLLSFVAGYQRRPPP